LPLLCPQQTTAELLELRNQDPAVAIWAWTPVECLSALCRLQRDGKLSEDGLRLGRRRLDDLRRTWSEVNELANVTARAERCLLLHPLRAADAGQLAAALLLSERLAQPIAFVTFDRRLAEAARREGFEVLGEAVAPVAHEVR
jgi:predicted nucleic acid-binding protein